MADLNVALILKFVDQATRPARAAVSAVERMGATTQRLGAAEIAQGRARIAIAQESTNQLLGEAGALAATGWAMSRASASSSSRRARPTRSNRSTRSRRKNPIR